MNSVFAHWAALRARVLMVLVGLGLAACGGGGVIPSPGVSLRPLEADFTARMAVAYSPYRTAANEAGLASETIPLANIKQDLQLLRDAGVGMVRVFDSSDKVAGQTVQAIRDLNLDMKVMLGVWIASTTGGNAVANAAANDAEIARAIALANAHPNIIKAVSVGNETLVSWNTWNPQSTANLASYIRMVRNAISQPVTTDDNWAFFAKQSGEQDPLPILKEIDFVAVHTYPLADSKYNLWDWRQVATPAAQRAAAMMDAAINKAKADVQAVRTHLDNNGYNLLPIVVGETGWKAVASNGESERAHPVNQKMYVERLRAWKQQQGAPSSIVYFAAFDEPWKQGDDKWGLFNVQRQARCAAVALNANLTPEAGSCDAAQAVYHIPVANQGTITANRYTVYAEAVTEGEARPSVAVLPNAWENNSTAAIAVESDATSGDGSSVYKITPNPLDWGWGMTFGLTGGAEVDLSNFAAGHLNLRIKTTYAGKLEIGFFTGSVSDNTAYDVYRAISSGDYGYQNDGQWHTVRIPVADLVARGAMAYGMNNPALSRLQLSRVANLLVVADRYAVTRNAANVREPILIDAVYWSR